MNNPIGPTNSTNSTNSIKPTETTNTFQYCLQASSKMDLSAFELKATSQQPRTDTYGTYGACACCKPGDFFNFLDKKRFVGPDIGTHSFNGFQGNRYMQEKPARSQQIQSFTLGNSGAPTSSKPNGISEE